MSRPVSATTAFDTLRRLGAESGAPLSAMVEIADRCNEACVHCYQVQGQKGELSTEAWKRVFDELAALGVLMLTISGGEATLRHDLLELIAYAREKGFCVRLYTNGLRVTEELAAALAEQAVQEVHISVYAADPEAHDWVTGVPGSHSRTLASMQRLVSHGVRVVAKIPLMTVNAERFDACVDLVTAMGAEYSFDYEIKTQEGGSRSPQAVSADTAQVLRVREQFDQRRLADQPPPKPLSASLCAAARSVHVEANGELRACQALEVSLGNAADGAREAWRESGVGEALRQLTWADVQGCRDCDLRAYCSRCHAMSRAEAGDALAPYPSGCDRARTTFARHHGELPCITDDPDDTGVGPYQRQADGTYRKVRAVLRPADRQLRQQHPWILGQRHEAPAERATPGALVQLRRPGRKPRSEQVPSQPTAGRE